MTIVEATWADLGYRELRSSPSPGHAALDPLLMQRLIEIARYERISDNWIRLPERRKAFRFRGSISITTVIDRSLAMDEHQYNFLDTIDSDWKSASDSGPQFRMTLTDAIELVNDAEKEPNRWRAFHLLSSAIAFADATWLKALIRDKILPAYFRWYPNGRVLALSYDARIDFLSSAMRVAYGNSLVPLQELKSESANGVAALRNWHILSLSQDIPCFIDYFNYLFYPYVGGARAQRPGLELVFLIDPMEKHEIGVFPRNLLAIPNQNAVFTKEYVSVEEIVMDHQGPTAARAGHHRYIHRVPFSADERLHLLEWYAERLNRVLFELSDMCNFTGDNNPRCPIDPVYAYEHQITIERLFRKTILAMSLDAASDANLMCYEIADLI